MDDSLCEIRVSIFFSLKQKEVIVRELLAHTFFDDESLFHRERE